MSVWNPITKVWEEESEYTKNYAKELEESKQKTSSATAPLSDGGLFKKPKSFNDGYQIGDGLKTVAATSADALVSGVKGIARFGETLVDLGRYGIGQVADILGADEYAKDVRDRAKENTMDQLFSPVENIYQKESVLGQTGRGVAEGIGNVIAMGNAGALLPGSSTVNVGKFAMPKTSIISGLGSGLNEAYSNNASDGQAWVYGTLSGLSEGFSESLFGGLGAKFSKVFGNGALDDTIIKKITDKISNKALKIVSQSGLKALGEGGEEVISGFGSAIAKKLTYLSDEDFKKIINDENLMDQFIIGTLTSTIMQTPSTISSVKTGRDYISGLTQNEQAVVNKEIENRKSQLENKNKKLTKQELSDLSEQVQDELKNGLISTDTIESVLGGDTYNQLKASEDKKNTMSNEIKKLENKNLTPLENSYLNSLKQGINQIDTNTLKTQLSTEMTQNIKNDGYLKNSYIEENNRNTKFEANLNNYDEKQQKTIKKAIDSGILNNTKKTHDFVDMIAKLSADKGVEFDFTTNENLQKSSFALEGKSINGYVNGNNITINLDSNKALNKVVGHEITHILEGTDLYADLQDVVKQYAISKGEYDSKKTNLSELYKDVENVNIDNELTADLIGDYLFSDRYFIMNLSVNKPNIFSKIYDEIKYLYKIVTAGSKEQRELEIIKKKFEKIYSENTAKDNEIVKPDETKYHVSENIEQEINNVINNIQERNPVRLRDYTPAVLVNNGIKDLPMYENPSHIRKNILTESEAKNLGLTINSNDHYHGLGKDLYINAIDNLDNPRVIFKNKNTNGYLILTSIKDKIGNNIIVPIEVETTTRSNNIEIDTNRIKSVYGKNNLNDYIKNNINQQLFIKIYEQKKEPGTGLIPAAGSDVDNISQNNNNVNRDTSSIKYSIQEKENNAKELENSSFYFEKNNSKANAKDIKYSLNDQKNDEFDQLPKEIKDYVLNTDEFKLYENEDKAPINKSLDELQEKLDNMNYNDDDFYKVKYQKDAVKNGVFISTSLIQAQEYAGGEGNKVYSKTINPERVAWINGDEGQYASINSKYSLSEEQNSDNRGNLLTKEQQEYFKDSKVRDGNGNLLTMYHGTPNGDFTVFKPGSYFSANEEYANGYQNEGASSISYGKVKTNPKTYEVYLNITNPFTLSNPAAKNIYINEYIKGGNSAYFDPYTDYTNTINNMEEIDWVEGEDLKEWLQENHPEFDGLFLDEGEDGGYGGAEYRWRGLSVLPFNSNQIKNVNNTTPTTNDDVRMSLSNKNEHASVTENYNVKGQEIKYDKNNLRNEDISKLALRQATPGDFKSDNKISVKETVQKKLDNNALSITKLQQAKNETTKNIDNNIAKKRDLYQSKKNKNTKIANVIQQQIISLENQKKNIMQAYDHRIELLEQRNEKMMTKEYASNLQRKNKNEEYRDEAESIIISSIGDWQDKSAGFLYKRETMERNINDIIPDKEVSKKVINTYIKPIYKATALQNKFINYYNNKIKALNLSKEESVAVQMLGEGKFNGTNIIADKKSANLIINDQTSSLELKDSAKLYLDAVDYIENNNLDYNKISNAIDEFRKIYDNLFVQINDVFKKQGFKEMDYRKDYFPHFTKEHPTGIIGKTMEKLGWKKIDNSIPTDIAGKTHLFKPNTTFFSHSLRRKGNTTEYNALEGFDNYIRGAADKIYLTESIQKLRALENEIRYLHSEKQVQKKYEEIIKSEDDQETKESQISLLFDGYGNPLNNFVTELRSYTDSIANKKSELDRRTEGFVNRSIYSTMTNIQQRVFANMVGLNISSAITNFIPITQAWSQVSTKNILKAISSTISSQMKNDGFADKSEFLVNRTQKADRLYKTGLDKFADKANIVFEGIDNFTSNVIVRSKYMQNLESGMSQSEAMNNANKFARNIMAGRDKGSLPTIFNSKNPVIKLFSAFQLEVNNQYSYMLKDLPEDMKKETLSKLIGAFAKMFFGAWLYNQISEKVVGRKAAFSPADIVLDSINTIENDNFDSFTKMSNITKDIVEEMPFVGGLFGGGRLPIDAAIPNLNTTIQSTVDSFDKKKRTTAIKNLHKELSKPIYYIGLPFGGGQLKKTVEGLGMYSKEIPGSYTSSGKLRFTADTTPLGVAQAAVFGQYASKNARDYFDNGYTPLSEKQQEEMKDLNVSIYKYRDYLSDLKELNKIKADKDKNGKPIAGTALAKSVYEIMNNDKKYTEKDINFYLSKLSSSDNPPKLEDISKLDNDLDIYKYYFSLGSYASKDKFVNITETYNISQKNYAKYSKDIKDINDKYSKSLKIAINPKEKERISNAKKQEIWQYVNNLPLSKVQKVLIYNSLGGYSITQYKNTMYSYINNLRLSKIEKEKLWKEIYN